MQKQKHINKIIPWGLIGSHTMILTSSIFSKPTKRVVDCVYHASSLECKRVTENYQPSSCCESICCNSSFTHRFCGTFLRQFLSTLLLLESLGSNMSTLVKTRKSRLPSQWQSFKPGLAWLRHSKIGPSVSTSGDEAVARRWSSPWLPSAGKFPRPIWLSPANSSRI